MFRIAIVVPLALYFNGCSKNTATLQNSTQPDPALGTVEPAVTENSTSLQKNPTSNASGTFTPSLNEQLWTAISSGSSVDPDHPVDRVKELIKQKASVDYVHFEGPSRTSVLNKAISTKQESIALLLVENGASVAPGLDLNPPITLATENNLLEVVKLLVQKNADINQVQEDDSTALMIAAQDGFFEIAKFLIEQKADVNYAESLGTARNRQPSRDTALSFALWRLTDEKRKIAELLIEDGADVNTWRGNLFASPFFYVCKSDNTLGLVKKMVQQGAVDLDLKNEKGATAMDHAAPGVLAFLKSVKSGTVLP